MSKVKVIVLTGYGTNCENEMAHACKLGGADQIDIVHVRDNENYFALMNQKDDRARDEIQQLNTKTG